MELIVISSPFSFTDENIIINNLFMAGVKYFHLRKPENDRKSIKNLLNGIAPQFYDRVVLHQFHELAPDYGIKRLHYTEKAREASGVAKWHDQLGNGLILSTSIHDVSLLPDLSFFDYVFYGPVFNSLSKPGYQSKLSNGFKLDKTNIRSKIIALGGIAPSNLLKVKQMGFDGAAVLGTLWNEPEKAVKSYHHLRKSMPA